MIQSRSIFLSINRIEQRFFEEHNDWCERLIAEKSFYEDLTNSEFSVLSSSEDNRDVD